MSAYNSEPLKELKSPFNLSKLPQNSSLEYQLDKSQDWVSELLIELNEKAQALPERMKLEQTSLIIDLELQKRFKGEYGEFVICEGSVSAHYFTECVKSLATMKETLEVDFKAMFLDSSYESMPEYEELTEAYFDQNVYDLYYFKRHHVDIKEMIHEVIFLNINPYPTREDNK